MSERLAIAGSGAIACGLAAVAATRGEVTVFARSDGSCDKASAKVHAICEKLGASVNGNVTVSRDPAVLDQPMGPIAGAYAENTAVVPLWFMRAGETEATPSVCLTASSI